MSDFIERQESKGISEINKFIDGLEEIFADLRERHVDDSVCGLCEYDGAYMGQSGDWCNECPGFDKDDCFKLSDETRKKWIEEIVNAYPDHTADIGKKVSISCGQENDLISRQAARHALCKAVHNGEDVPCENQTASCLWTGTRVCDFVREIDALPPARPETCEGCKHLGKWENEVEYGYPSPCTRCRRRAEDHYER